MVFDFYAWQKAGRPAAPSNGSDGYEIRAHWKFNTPEDYSPVVINGQVVILTKIGYFSVNQSFIINNPVNQ